jgi:hypothetical protein
VSAPASDVPGSPAKAETLCDIEVRKTNELLNGSSYWDGFWIMAFEAGVLSIAGSFDRSYRRDVELRFIDTVFFNLPVRWTDTETKTGLWFRSSAIDELLASCGAANALDHDKIKTETWLVKNVYAFDLEFALKVDGEIALRKLTFFVVAGYFEAFKVIVGDGGASYADPCATDHFPSFRNRVPLLVGEDSLGSQG